MSHLVTFWFIFGPTDLSEIDTKTRTDLMVIPHIFQNTLQCLEFCPLVNYSQLSFLSAYVFNGIWMIEKQTSIFSCVCFCLFCWQNSVDIVLFWVRSCISFCLEKFDRLVWRSSLNLHTTQGDRDCMSEINALSIRGLKRTQYSQTKYEFLKNTI